MFWKRNKKPEPKAGKSQEKPTDIYSFMEGVSMDTAAALRQFAEDNAAPVSAPQPKSADGTAMDSGCAPVAPISYDAVNPVVFAHYVATGQFIGYPAMAVIAQHWLVRKGCESKPRDAVRKWYEIGCEGDEITADQIKAIEKLDRRYRLKRNVVEGCTFNNIFGVRHILFKHRDKNFDYSRPFNPEEFRDGGYAGIAQIDPLRVTPEFRDSDLSDATSMTFLEPTWWWVNGTRIHKSHMVILTGDMVPDLLKPTYRYGGVSKVQKVYERVYAAERTANESPQLAMTKRLTWRKTDLDKVAAQPGKFGRTMQKLAELRNNFGVEVMGKNDEMGQMDTALTDLDQVIMGQYQLVCSIFDEPASKLMGTGHQGFSTGEADIDYRIESLEELQANEMTEIVEAHYRRLIPAYAADLGIDPGTSVYPEWNALKIMSDAEKADVNLKNRQADKLAYEMQSVDNFEVRQRLANDPSSGFDNLTMPEEEPEPEQTDEEDAAGGEKAKAETQPPEV